MSKRISRHLLLSWKHAEGVLFCKTKDSLPPEKSMQYIGIFVNLDREIDI